MAALNLPIACDLRAIPARQRADHMRAAEHLLLSLAIETQELPNGYTFLFAADHFTLVTTFIAKERLCCPFCTFTLEVPPGGAPISLHISGPEGAKEVLPARRDR